MRSDSSFNRGFAGGTVALFAALVLAVIYHAGNRPVAEDYCKYNYSEWARQQTAICPEGDRPVGAGWVFQGSNAGTALFFQEPDRG